MSANPLFYRSIKPLNRENNRDLSLASGPNSFKFAKPTHVVPALIEEFAIAARTLPIVFAGNAPRLSPVS